jgi:outer membrane protein assembly factor BamB
MMTPDPRFSGRKRSALFCHSEVSDSHAEGHRAGDMAVKGSAKSFVSANSLCAKVMRQCTTGVLKLNNKLKSSWLARRGMVSVGSSVLAIICVGTPMTARAQSASSIWPMFKHDLRHTGLGTSDTNANPGTLKWVLNTANQLDPSAAIGVSSSPTIGVDGTIYVGGDNLLYAVNPDGVVKWKMIETGSAIGFSSPAIAADGTVYIGSFDGNLYAINDGGQGIVTEKWAFQTGDVIDSSPTIGLERTIYVGSADDSLYAVNRDGTLKWKFTTGGPIENGCSPAIGADGTIYIGSFDGNLYALTDGGQGIVTEKWAFPTGGNVYSSPTVGADGTVYIGSFDGNLYAVNSDGALKWKFVTGASVFSSPAIGSDGTIYFGSNDDNLYALTDNGDQAKEKWAFKIGGEFSGPAIGSDGTVFVASENANVYAITDNVTSASQKWAFATGASVFSSPAIGADGTIYFGSDDDNLYAVGVSAPSVPVKLEITPRSLDFGTVRAGRFRGPRNIIVRNPKGNRKKPGLTVVIQGERLNGPFIPFSVTNGCSPSLPAGAECKIGVTFAPDQTESVRSTLMIFDNALKEPQLVNLRGKGK